MWNCTESDEVRRRAPLSLRSSISQTTPAPAPELGEEVVVQQVVAGVNADVKAVDEVGEAPIHVACARGVLNILLALTEQGADINCTSNAGVAPIHKAASFGQMAIVKNLIKQGVHCILMYLIFTLLVLFKHYLIIYCQ